MQLGRGFLTLHSHYTFLCLDSSAASMQVTDQRKAWKEYYQGWQDSHPSTLVAEADFVWALECVRSRAFSGPWSGVSPPAALMLRVRCVPA